MCECECVCALTDEKKCGTASKLIGSAQAHNYRHKFCLFLERGRVLDVLLHNTVRAKKKGASQEALPRTGAFGSAWLSWVELSGSVALITDRKSTIIKLALFFWLFRASENVSEGGCGEKHWGGEICWRAERPPTREPRNLTHNPQPTQQHRQLRCHLRARSLKQGGISTVGPPSDVGMTTLGWQGCAAAATATPPAVWPAVSRLNVLWNSCVTGSITISSVIWSV